MTCADASPATQSSLPMLVGATDEEREAFRTAWYARVRTVLSDDLCAVGESEREF